MATIRDYICNVDGTTASVRVTTSKKSKASFEALPTLAELQAIDPSVEQISLNNCFSGCRNMIASPEIPTGVYEMLDCFSSCISLAETPSSIPSTVYILAGCFQDCVSLKTVRFNIGPNAQYINNMFKGCSSLLGRIVINCDYGSQSNYSGCFSDTEKPIVLSGTSNSLVPIANTSENGNVWRYVAPPSPLPTWQTPVTNRIAGSRTSYNDMNRLVGNTYVLGGYPIKYGYTQSDFVMDNEWRFIVAWANVFADELGIQKATESTSYTNLNKIENIHKLYHESLSE